MRKLLMAFYFYFFPKRKVFYDAIEREAVDRAFKKTMAKDYLAILVASPDERLPLESADDWQARIKLRNQMRKQVKKRGMPK